MSTLYVVSTPIGNLSDITIRARDILETVSRVLAEDTRRTGLLMNHLGLATPMVSLHEHNERAREERVLAWLAEGEDLALVSDAGTPLVSDPGSRLVRAVTEAGHRIVPIPGASAVLAAIVGSGIPCEQFTFLGFLPRKGKERAAMLERIARSGETTLVFESPARLARTLVDLAGACGDARPVCVARELTKLHEELVRGTLAQASVYYEAHPPRGEVTLVIGAAEVVNDGAERAAAARTLAEELLRAGTPASRVAREVARKFGLPRNEAYRIVHDLPRDTDGIG